MLEKLLLDGWLTIFLAGSIFVGNLYATGLGGWRRGLKVIGVGALVPWLIWVAIVVWCKETPGGDCRFVIGAGVFMVGAAGSAFWLASALPGLIVGLFGRWWMSAIAGRTRDHSLSE